MLLVKLRCSQAFGLRPKLKFPSQRLSHRTQISPFALPCSFGQLSTVNPLSTVNCQLSTVNCQLSTVNCQLSTVNCQLSTVNSSAL
ncbi:MAG: hypothetical protein JGK01_29635 [Microcoleus sp. PH2017_03_ELD_O_A]|nr:hypothetical protein [Microcoleus sp. PH2017_03_ELD_O_A]